MSPNTNYGMRHVSAQEIATACGSARRALELTGGDEATALYLLHNPEAMGQVVTKPLPSPLSRLGVALRELANEAEDAERQKVALAAWNEHKTLAAVMRACHAGFATAKRLVGEARAA